MKRVNFKNNVGAHLCVRPMAGFIFRPMANFSIRVFTMALAIMFALASCGNDDDGDKDDDDDGKGVEGDYAFPCMSGPLASYWKYTSEAINMRLNTPTGSDWTVTFDDTEFREKTKEDELDLGGFPAGFSGGFTVTVNGEEVKVLDVVDVNNGDIRILFDYTGAKATDVVRVKYDKPAQEKWHIPYDDTGVNPVKGVLQSFGYTAPIKYEE